MALSKAIEMGNLGVNMTYWRITRFDVSVYPSMGTNITISGYVDQAARDAGKQPGTAYKYKMGEAETAAFAGAQTTGTETLYNEIASILYDFLKNTHTIGMDDDGNDIPGPFRDAVDV